MMGSRYGEALDARASALRFVRGPSWDNYIRAVDQDMPGKEMQLKDPKSTFYRFRVAANGALTRGPTYWWSRSTCQAIESTYRGIPDAPLSLEDVVSGAGFMYYEQPIKLGTSDRTICATAWIGIAEDDGAVREEMALFSDLTGVAVIHFSRPPVGHIVPVTMSPWTTGDTIKEHYVKSLEVSGESTRRAMEQGLYTNGDVLRLFLAGQLFLQQKCVVATREEAPREVARRIRRDVPSMEPEVTVVYLREVEGREPAGHSRSVDWKSRWWVGLETFGFWRNQPYRSTGEVKRILIAPYVKGPRDKPIKAPKPSIRAVVR